MPLYLHLLSVQSDAFPLPRHLRGEHFQAAMLDALAAFFTSFARPAPVLAPPRGLALGGRRRRVQALRRVAELVGAYPLADRRHDPAGARHAGWTRAEQTLRIHLRPLDFPASLAIMQAVLGVERVPDALARVLHERAGGNPFFLEEMCHGAARSRRRGRVASGEAVVDGSVDALPLPDTRPGGDPLTTRSPGPPTRGSPARRVGDRPRVRARISARGGGRIVDLDRGDRRAEDAGIIQQIARGARSGLSLQARADPGGQLRQPGRAPAEDAASGASDARSSVPLAQSSMNTLERARASLQSRRRLGDGDRLRPPGRRARAIELSQFADALDIARARRSPG